MAAVAGCLATAIMDGKLMLAAFTRLDMQQLIITIICTKNSRYDKYNKHETYLTFFKDGISK